MSLHTSKHLKNVDSLGIIFYVKFMFEHTIEHLLNF